METLEIQTAGRDQLRDLTREVQAVVARSGVRRGQVLVFVPHTTAGVTLNENADPSVAADLLAALDRAVPWAHPAYRHGEGNSAAHVKASLLGSSVWVPVEHARLLLGQWQAIYLAEFDGPRTRRVWVQVTPAERPA